MPRRAQTSTPPKPASDILANATNSATRPGGVDGANSGISGAGTATGGESGDIIEIRTAAAPGQPIFSAFHFSVVYPEGRGSPAKRPSQTLFFPAFAPYIEGAGLPAMEINCR